MRLYDVILERGVKADALEMAHAATCRSAGGRYQEAAEATRLFDELTVRQYGGEPKKAYTWWVLGAMARMANTGDPDLAREGLEIGQRCDLEARFGTHARYWHTVALLHRSTGNRAGQEQAWRRTQASSDL